MERIAMATASPRIPFTYRYGNVGWRSKLHRERKGGRGREGKRERERGRERENEELRGNKREGDGDKEKRWR